MVKACYIHIPFCKKICSYCDFCKMYYKEEWVDFYLDALEKEIRSNYQFDKLKTIYIGGGTPSCLNRIQLERLFQILRIFKLNKNYEFTFECNVSDINQSLLNFLKNNKVNRLSIGVETFDKSYLALMNRDYTYNIEEKINLCKKYFDNVNIDLIYGISSQTISELKIDLKKFLELEVEHISIYSLILEEHTLLNSNNYKELNEDVQRMMYDLIRKTLKKNNYIQYEISNFSKKGYQSKHNLTYWNNEEYYGFGLGASGYINNIRYTNTKSLNKYLKGLYISSKEEMTEKITMENEMILGLRKRIGVSKKSFYKKYHKNIDDIFDVKKLKENKNYYYIPSKYLFVSNSILIDFINIEE